MSVDLYEFALPSLPVGRVIEPSFKKEFEVTAQRAGIPLAEAETLYRQTVTWCLHASNPRLMLEELRHSINPHENFLDVFLELAERLPTYKNFLRVFLDPKHPLYFFVWHFEDAVIEQLPRA